MGHVVVALDVVDIDRLRDVVRLIKILEISEEVGVINDSPGYI